MEGANVIQAKRKLEELSVQQLVDCVSHHYGCQGGTHEVAYDYIIEHGIATAKSYPYMMRDTQCNPPQYTWTSIKGRHPIQEGNENELKEAVALKVKNDINTDDGAECDTLTLPRDPSLWPYM